MMFMHMPKRIGIPVMVVVAACLAAYWWFVVAPVRVGDWEIYQGTGQLVFPEGEEPYVEISYTVRAPARPLFCCLPRAGGRGVDGGEMRIACSSEWPTTLRVVVEEKDGAAYEAHVTLASGEGMLRQSLPEGRFQRVRSVARSGDKLHPDFRMLRPKISFYDGSGVRQPSTRFSNRVCFEAVVLDTR